MNQFNWVIVTILYCFGVFEKVTNTTSNRSTVPEDTIGEGQGVFVSQSQTKWDESTCTLAQPDIICSDDGSCVVENGLEFLNNTNIPENGVWIGFTKTWISYAYVGCNQVNVGAEYSVLTFGECRRTTGCQTFGIRNSTDGLRCKCAINSQVHSGTCRRKCKEADQYPCGDTTDTTIFSIYTVEKVPLSSNLQDKERNCLMFFYGYGGKGHDFYWQSCNLSTTPALLCSDTNFSDQNQMALRNPSRYMKWALAVDQCFVGERFPVTILSIKNTQFTDQFAQDFWTGIIKKESIISLNFMLDNSTNPTLSFAYAEQVNQTFNVRFANEGESKKSLCAGDDTSATPSISTRETQPNVFSTSTTTQVKSTKESTTLIAVGVSIAVILLVAVVLAVMIKRRGMLRTCFKNAVIEKTTFQTTTEVSTTVDNQQRVEYVNTANNDMHRNTGDSREAQTYEKLNITSSSDNYLSIQEIDTDGHAYQNT